MTPEKFSCAPVKDPRRWPKALRVEHLLGRGGAVEGEKGFRRARGVGVNHPREHFLARARFAGDEDRRRRGCDAASGGEERLHLLGEEDAVSGIGRSRANDAPVLTFMEAKW